VVFRYLIRFKTTSNSKNRQTIERRIELANVKAHAAARANMVTNSTLKTS
jgi:hypothetical protein